MPCQESLALALGLDRKGPGGFGTAIRKHRSFLKRESKEENEEAKITSCLSGEIHQPTVRYITSSC